MRIDAHQHFWHFDPTRDAWITEPDMSIIRRDFLLDNLRPILKKNNFSGCVAVQADQSEKETEFLLSLAQKNDFIKGVVGWVDLKADNLQERLEYFSEFPRLKGFRHILQSENPEFMLDPKFIKGLSLIGKKGYTYDFLVFPKHLKAVKKLIKILGDQLFVIDHMAKPDFKKRKFSEWKLDMQAIAKNKNVYCKLSGLVTEADWKKWQPSDFEPSIGDIFTWFGEDRIMYGSDWPVCLVAATYEQQLSVIENYVSKNKIDTRKIFGENAKVFYKI